jgi:enoyl-CoA hydratase/carnithine racemase
VLGKSRAIELMASGDTFDFERAQQLGIVDHVWDDADATAFHARVVEWVRGFVPPRAPSRAVGFIKRACQSGAEIGIHEGLALERELQQRLFEGEDAGEGIAAYLEKRTPEFRGR